MATYMLVPGAWIGGWAYREVAAGLRRVGHDVYPITLTGLGERVHLARPEVDLETHITDVVNTILWNDLQEVILVGHSYAGTVVTGVADRIPHRLSHLVYLDSAPLADGMRMTDVYPPEAVAELERSVREEGDGWRWLFPGFERIGQDASLAGLSEAALALMREKAVPQPWGTYTQPLRLRGEDAGSFQRVAVACDDMRGLIAAGIPQAAAMASPPWHYLELPTGHWPMLSMPADLAAMLDGLTREE